MVTRILPVLALLVGCGGDVKSDFHLQLDPFVLPGHDPVALGGRAGITVRDASGTRLFDIGPVGGDLTSEQLPPLDAARVGLVFDTDDGKNDVIDAATAYGEAGPFTLALGGESLTASFAFGIVGAPGALGSLGSDASGLRGAAVTLSDGTTFLFGGSKNLYSGRSHSAVQRLGNPDLGDWAWQTVADLPDFDDDGDPDPIVNATASVIVEEGVERILFVGGRASTANPTQNSGWAGIFDPTELAWVWTGEALDTARSEHLGLRFNDGNVLVYGGILADGQVGEATWEVFDVPTRTFLYGEGPNPLSGVATAGAVLGDRGALVCGGGTFFNEGAGQQRTEPESGCVIVSQGGKTREAAPLPEARQLLAIASLGDGRALACGGTGDVAREGENAAAVADAWVFDPEIGDAGQWTAVSPMTTPRMQHEAIPMPDGRVLITGGVASGGLVAPSLEGPLDCDEIFDPRTGAFTAVAPCGIGGADPTVAWHPDYGAIVVEGAGETDGGGEATALVPFPPASPAE